MGVSELKSPRKQVREFRPLLGKEMMEVEILVDALGGACEIN